MDFFSTQHQFCEEFCCIDRRYYQKRRLKSMVLNLGKAGNFAKFC